MAELSIKEMSSGYYGKPVLHDVDLEVDEPGIYVVLGKNGAGKTTFFRTVGGILRPLAGSINIDGKDPYNDYETRMRCVYLSHLSGVPTTMKVSGIMDLFTQLMDATGDDCRNVVEKLELQELMEKRFMQLSQGQKKRVSIAKCLLKERDVYLFDEPTSNLDPILAAEVRKTILEIARNKTVFYSSHNLYEAREIGKNVLIIDSGRIVYSGDIDEIPMGKYVIGIPSPDVLKVYPEARKEGRYYLIELDSPDDVNEVIGKLSSAGVRIREVREMSNPLEDLLK